MKLNSSFSEFEKSEKFRKLDMVVFAGMELINKLLEYRMYLTKIYSNEYSKWGQSVLFPAIQNVKRTSTTKILLTHCLGCLLYVFFLLLYRLVFLPKA